ncbi:MAG: IPT/TIG domain-containing protein [Bacteroidota bacterium]
MNQSINKTLLFFAILFAFSQCQQAEITTEGYPLIVMDNIETSSEGVMFKAKVTSRGNQAFESFGFVWDAFSTPFVETSNIIESTDIPSGDDLILEVNSGLLNGRIYTLRPFVRTADRLIYGPEEKFVSDGGKDPRILDFQPKVASVNQIVELSGEFFSPSVAGNVVKVGNITATVDSASTTSIFFRVPLVMKDTMLQISIETTLKTASFNESLSVVFPWESVNKIADLPMNSTLFTIENKTYLVPSRSASMRSTTGVGLLHSQPENTISNFSIPANTYGSSPLSFTIGNKAYVLFEESFYEYDPSIDVWIRKADFPDTETNKSFAFSFGFSDFGVIGFYRNNNTVWAYDQLADEWVIHDLLPDEIRDNSISIRNQFYFTIGNEGYFGFTKNIMENIFWKYNSDTGRWTELQAYEREFIAAPMIINDEIFLGLADTPSQLDDVWIKLNPSTNELEEFQNHEDITFPNYSFSSNGKGYIFNNDLEGFTVWEFIPEKN